VLQAVAPDSELSRLASAVIGSTTSANIPAEFQKEADNTSMHRRRVRMPHHPNLDDPSTLVQPQPVDQPISCPLPSAEPPSSPPSAVNAEY
jgi:hypothetical protein